MRKLFIAAILAVLVILSCGALASAYCPNRLPVFLNGTEVHFDWVETDMQQGKTLAQDVVISVICDTDTYALAIPAGTTLTGFNGAKIWFLAVNISDYIYWDGEHNNIVFQPNYVFLSQPATISKNGEIIASFTEIADGKIVIR